MTLYATFHLAVTIKGLSVCAHPAALFKCEESEVFGPFDNEEAASEFINAIMEGQVALFERLGQLHIPKVNTHMG